MNTMRGLCLLLAAALSAPIAMASVAGDAPFQLQASQLQADYWIARLPAAAPPLLDAAQVQAFNAHLLRHDAAMHDLQALPDRYSAAQVRAQVLARSAPPTRTLYDTRGVVLDAAQLTALQSALALDTIPAQVAPRYALVVRRADLRTFPTRQRVFSSRDDHDIDRFQESALFPGTAVAILHASGDGQWLFVLAPNYAAWIERDRLAEGERDAVLGYAQRTPRLLVTGARVLTAFTPEVPTASQLSLDMGASLPLLQDWPAQQTVNGQSPLAAYVVQLPLRDAEGRLRLAPALVPRSADVATAALPATQRTLLLQAFKFLGERYGWGNDYAARDCSGFVADVYRSLGIALPRNTGDQARSPSLTSVPYVAAAPLAQRRQTLSQLQAGDLVYIPGHVMLVIGHDRGATWVIHDIAGASYRDASAQLQRVHLNGVSVTPLEPMLLSDGTPFIDRITRIRRVRPIAAE
ncbi:SH3 domain-containing protein [Xanthomonas translucens]|uniref:C40 family peptidase n=1 Tax=Xanthomonas campestris pv. translucens TaxID=343 RepID=UPI001297B77D|nr:SH3 domain-containing protein [Xanthomonas translucens]MQS40313.1 NlpC-P60 family protein [Xanthomonas translucens pv. translucens]QSQ38024.1 SH3 domain-containing protein [Xanthomonas translucens pv. translucens]QSQ45345.1 SH3 domain-containing protein [Xanthomonas translucens pv. translucens]